MTGRLQAAQTLKGDGGLWALKARYVAATKAVPGQLRAARDAEDHASRLADTLAQANERFEALKTQENLLRALVEEARRLATTEKPSNGLLAAFPHGAPPPAALRIAGVVAVAGVPSPAASPSRRTRPRARAPDASSRVVVGVRGGRRACRRACSRGGAATGAGSRRRGRGPRRRGCGRAVVRAGGRGGTATTSLRRSPPRRGRCRRGWRRRSPPRRRRHQQRRSRPTRRTARLHARRGGLMKISSLRC